MTAKTDMRQNAKNTVIDSNARCRNLTASAECMFYTGCLNLMSELRKAIHCRIGKDKLRKLSSKRTGSFSTLVRIPFPELFQGQSFHRSQIIGPLGLGEFRRRARMTRRITILKNYTPDIPN